MSTDDLPPTKRLRTAPSVDECFLLAKPEILIALVKSRCLNDKETARLFLLSAKAITNHAVLNNLILLDGTVADEWVWKELCERKWGLKSTAKKLVHTGWTHKKFYRKFALKIDKENKPQMEYELKYSPQDYSVIVELRGDMDVCKTIRGSQIKDFFQSGKAKVEYEFPIWKGKKPENRYWKSLDFRPTVSILRRPDDKLVQMGSAGLWLALDFDGDEVDVDIADWDYDDMCEGQEVVLRKPFIGRASSLRVDVWPIFKKIKSNRFGIFGFELQGKFILGGDWDYECEEECAEDALRGGKHQFAHYLECVEGFVTF